MKILLVNDFEDKGGGSELYNHNLKKILENKGHRVKIFGGNRKYEGSPRSYFYSWYNIREKKQISRILDEFKPDIVQCHNIFGYLSPSILIEIKRRNIPIVMKIGDVRLLCPKFDLVFQNKKICRHSHSLECLTTSCLFSRPGLKKKLHSIIHFNKLTFHWYLIKRYVDVFVVPSKFISFYLKKFVNKPIYVIRNPIFWRLKFKNITKKEKKITYVGNINYHKGTHIMIQAINKLKDEYPHINVEIVGDGPEKKSLANLVRAYHLDKQTSFLGNIPHEKVKEKYRESYLFVLPSIIAENSPLTILEAMSQGTPVITTNIGGQKEIVIDGKTGFLAKPKDSRDLAEKMKIVLEDEKLQRKMSLKALEEARKFSKEKHARRVEELFQFVIAKRAQKDEEEIGVIT